MGTMTTGDIWYAVTLAVVLVAVILLMAAIYQFLIEPARKREKVNRRLRENYQERLQQIRIFKERLAKPTGWWPKLLNLILGEKLLARLKSRMLQADMHQDPGTFIRMSLYLVALGLIIGYFLFSNPFLGIFLTVALGTVPFYYLKMRRQQKTKKFEVQMPDAMELLARSLRAGHTLPSALELIGTEMEPPMSTEMGLAYEEQQYGISTSEAMVHMLERVDSLDLKYFVSAVLIQQETGGNLAELMENIANVVRNRLNFKAKVRGLTAMGRISTTIMIVVPIIAFFLLMVVAHEYEKALIQTPVGQKMLMAGVGCILIGGYLLKKLINSVET
jgi:tight adherence protein B